MRILTTISILSLLLLSSCLGGTDIDYKEIKVGDTYQLRIPESMQQSNELHDFAQLQYSDDKEGFFLIGINEPKDDLNRLQLFYGLEEYAHFGTRTVSQGLDTVNVSSQSSQEINGIPCVSTDLFGAMTSGEVPIEVYYRLMVLESNKNFYQLIACSSRAKSPRFNSIVDEIECSFSELASIEPIIEHDLPGGTEPASASSAAEIAH